MEKPQHPKWLIGISHYPLISSHILIHFSRPHLYFCRCATFLSILSACIRLPTRALVYTHCTIQECPSPLPLSPWPNDIIAYMLTGHMQKYMLTVAKLAYWAPPTYQTRGCHPQGRSRVVHNPQEEVKTLDGTLCQSTAHSTCSIHILEI